MGREVSYNDFNFKIIPPIHIKFIPHSDAQQMLLHSAFAHNTGILYLLRYFILLLFCEF